VTCEGVRVKKENLNLLYIADGMGRDSIWWKLLE
jgi:hypothetical protein